MAIKVAIPVLAAAGVGAAAIAGWSADAPSGNGKSSSAGLAGQAAPAMPQAYVGDPGNPATWRLPIEAYMPTRAETRLISGARDSLIDECMKGAGYEKWSPAPDLPTLGGKTLTDWRYGIHDAEKAAERGYHPDAAEQKAYDEAQLVGAVDISGADEGTLRGCVQAADGQVPAAQPNPLVQKINGEVHKKAAKNPKVIAVFAKWSSCMKAKGYSYEKPMDANDDPRFSDPYKVTELEIATAKADVACRDLHDVEKIWFDSEVPLQQQSIKENQAPLDGVKAENKSAVDKASRL
ncbi:hypothetical protein [Streptomyces sp. NBC_01244]|uniref:hypothetical protein n=1 Tax=Streptomyces sp. NBC_01244 TaxID=2903797 RepID=UPI002E1161A3|nr:hypothetical protein OG247_31580 [Streptomyces sp. NBC_01244]